MWYGVDPLYEKYPDMSPYVYCAGNPVNLVDPDGMDWYSCTEDGTTSYYWRAGKDAVIKIGGKEYVNKGDCFEEDGIYYGLFGDKIKSNSHEGKAIKKIDVAIKRTVKADIENCESFLNPQPFSEYIETDPMCDFLIDKEIKGNVLNDTKNQLYFKYGGGDCVFTIYTKKNRGYRKCWPDKYVVEGDFQGNSRQGYFLKFLNGSGNQGGLNIVNVKFTKESAMTFMKNLYFQFPKLKILHNKLDKLYSR